jgi:transposase-like protein
MAKDHRRLAEEVAQGILLDDPGFLKEIVERVLQELLEAEMTEHVGVPLPTSAPPSAKGIATATNPALSGRG